MVSDQQKQIENGAFRWRVGPPLVAIRAENLPPSPDNPWHAVKDPSIVRFRDRWHLFCTLRKRRGADGKPPGYIRIGYLSFREWRDADRAKWSLLTLSDDYHGAPQVFFFSPQRTWYLLYQLADNTRHIPYGPCFSTTKDITDPASWSAPTPLYPGGKPEHVPGWLDFWVIGDDTTGKAYLFFTSLNGCLWRAETWLSDFPNGFGRPEIALRGDFFEASHTYRLRGDGFLTLIEAQGRSGGRGHRFYKAYRAERLAGPWREWAATPEKPFAGSANVTPTAAARWTDSISHGELLRTGYDERLEVDPDNLRFLFQGQADEERASGIWRLGLLDAV
jgi:hypothetical protein